MRDADRLASAALREVARKKRKLVERDAVARVIDCPGQRRHRCLSHHRSDSPGPSSTMPITRATGPRSPRAMPIAEPGRNAINQPARQHWEPIPFIGPRGNMVAWIHQNFAWLLAPPGWIGTWDLVY